MTVAKLLQRGYVLNCYRDRYRDRYRSGGITAGQFGAMPHLKFKIFTQFSVALRKGFLNF
jgi:hypothetical protein